MEFLGEGTKDIGNCRGTIKGFYDRSNDAEWREAA
jgi:hypothetical protein